MAQIFKILDKRMVPSLHILMISSNKYPNSWKGLLSQAKIGDEHCQEKKLYSTNETLHKGPILFLWGEHDRCWIFLVCVIPCIVRGSRLQREALITSCLLPLTQVKIDKKTQVSKKFLVIDERGYVHLWGTNNFGYFAETKITL